MTDPSNPQGEKDVQPPYTFDAGNVELDEVRNEIRAWQHAGASSFFATEASCEDAPLVPCRGMVRRSTKATYAMTDTSEILQRVDEIEEWSRQSFNPGTSLHTDMMYLCSQLRTALKDKDRRSI